jgi:hypothetical protein
MVPNLVLPAPTQADLQTTAGWMLRTYPVSNAASFRVAGNYAQTLPLQDPALPNSCTVNWDDLMSHLHNVATADGNQAGWVYYGLLPNGIPMRPVVGCGGGGLGVGEVGDGQTMAEEIGHALGLAHAPCGNPPHPDPNYPAYEPYDALNTPTAHIGEFGLDISNGTIHPPTEQDFMSYCLPEWISLYHHSRLLNLARLTPVSVLAGSIRTVYVKDKRSMKPQPVISLLAFIDPDDEIVVRSVARLVTRPETLGGQSSEIIAELLDAEGKILSTATAYKVRLEAPGLEGCPNLQPCRYMIKAFLSDVAPGAMLRLRRGNEVLWSRQSPAVPVSVREVRAKIEEKDQLSLQWESVAAHDTDLEIWVRWSNDQGETWHVLTVGLKGQAATLDLANVPGGKLLFQVMVHDGFNTGTALSNPVDLPHKPPVATILHPEEGDQVVAGRLIRLWGSATDEANQPLPPETSQWLLDGQPLEGGPDIFIAAPVPGQHKVILQVKDRHGYTEVHHTFTVVEEPKE